MCWVLSVMSFPSRYQRCSTVLLWIKWTRLWKESVLKVHVMIICKTADIFQLLQTVFNYLLSVYYTESFWNQGRRRASKWIILWMKMYFWSNYLYRYIKLLILSINMFDYDTENVQVIYAVYYAKMFSYYFHMFIWYFLVFENDLRFLSISHFDLHWKLDIFCNLPVYYTCTDLIIYWKCNYDVDIYVQIMIVASR